MGRRVQKRCEHEIIKARYCHFLKFRIFSETLFLWFQFLRLWPLVNKGFFVRSFPSFMQGGVEDKPPFPPVSSYCQALISCQTIALASSVLAMCVFERVQPRSLCVRGRVVQPRLDCSWSWLNRRDRECHRFSMFSVSRTTTLFANKRVQFCCCAFVDAFVRAHRCCPGN